MTAISESFMQGAAAKAREGLLTTVRINLLPGLSLYRFANSARPDLYYTGAWWINYSPFQALKSYAALRGQSLSMAARQCLAIDWGWSNVDILVEVTMRVRLSAWSGAPKTQVMKNKSHYSGVRWEPDRDITQIFVPGLDQPAPADPTKMIWQSAFIHCKFPVRL